MKLGRNWIVKEVSIAIKESSVNLTIKKKLTITGMIPRIYGIPKIHKEGTALQPIVDTNNSPIYKLPRFLASKLKPLVNNTNSFIEDSTSFTEMIKNHKFEANDIILSIDVVFVVTYIVVGLPLFLSTFLS